MELLFEAYYGYKPSLFDAVIARECISDQTVLADMLRLHQEKLAFIEQLMDNDTSR